VPTRPPVVDPGGTSVEDPPEPPAEANPPASEVSLSSESVRPPHATQRKTAAHSVERRIANATYSNPEKLFNQQKMCPQP
jgi:hypothetical protein